MTLTTILTIVGKLASHFCSKRRCGHTSSMFHGIAKTDKPALIIAADQHQSNNLLAKLPPGTKTTTLALPALEQYPLEAFNGPVALDNHTLAHLLSETSSHLARHSHAEFALESVKATLEAYRGETTASTIETMQHDINRALKAIDDYQSPDGAAPSEGQ
jgi:hypothetical protein